MDRQCPITKAAKVIGRKWTLEMIYYLRERKRFCELQEIVGGVNPTTLTQRLKVLEQSGIIQRYAISNAPRHVEYDLTEKGKDLLSVIHSLGEWVGRWNPVEEK
jgi:DNA-binding HxlR family transcriptional regulator